MVDVAQTFTDELKPSFIFGVPKSGTTLLTSLLDGHRELLVFPEEFDYLNFPMNGGINKDDVIYSMFPAKKVPRFQGELTYAETLNKENKAYSELDYQRFSTVATDYYTRNSIEVTDLRELRIIANSALLTGYNSAVRSNDRAIAMTRWVVKKVGMEAKIEQVLADFPNAKIIYVVRNPAENAYSRAVKRQRKHQLLNGATRDRHFSDGNLSYHDLLMWRASAERIAELERRIAESIMVVRYEDLVATPVDTVRRIAEFFEIAYEPILLEPTFMGTPWAGNSMRDRKFAGVTVNPKVVVDPAVVDVVAKVCGTENLRRFGYLESVDRSPRLSWPPRLISEPLHKYFIIRVARLFGSKRATASRPPAIPPVGNQHQR